MNFEEKLKKYAHYKKTIKGLKKKQRALKEELEKEFQKRGIDKPLRKPYGLFILKDSKKYNYSKKVDFIKDSLNYQRQLERMDGKATATIKKYLYFK